MNATDAIGAAFNLAAGVLRVEPGDPDGSIFLQKLLGQLQIISL